MHNSRTLNMLGIFAALLGAGDAGSKNIPRSASFHGGYGRSRSKQKISDSMAKKRKLKNRAENKARSIHARVKRSK